MSSPEIAFQRTDDEAARLGHPSYVWRAGQERRLSLVRRWADLQDARILDAGCGVGMYTAQFAKFSERVTGVEIDYRRRGRRGQCGSSSRPRRRCRSMTPHSMWYSRMR